MRAPRNNLSDRERILMYLAARSACASPLGGKTWVSGPEGDTVLAPLWRFAERGEPVAGQLVVATTSSHRPHPHVMGECVGREDLGPDYSERDVPLIRAFGDPPEAACRYFNESFYIFNDEWRTSPVFFEGWQRLFYLRLCRAIPKAGDDYKYKLGVVRFEGDKAFARIRPHIFYQGLEPFEITLRAGPKVLLRQVVEDLQAGGFGTRWERKKK